MTLFSNMMTFFLSLFFLKTLLEQVLMYNMFLDLSISVEC